MQNTKEDILKKHTVLVTTDFHCMDSKNLRDSQNIFFYVPQTKESHTGLEWQTVRVSKWWQNFHFWGDYIILKTYVLTIMMRCVLLIFKEMWHFV